MKNVPYLNFATILHTEFLVNGMEGNRNNLSVLTIHNTKKIIPDYIPSFTQDVSRTLDHFLGQYQVTEVAFSFWY